MCNLYTYGLSRDEIRGLLQNYKLVGQQWSEMFDREMAGKNDEALVYPKYPAPVVIVRDGRRELDHMVRACRHRRHRSSPARRPSGRDS
jgi:hypothetical protein